jgi:hypothetical protein
VSVTQRRIHRSIDDQVEAKRKVIRQSLAEITVEVENALRAENLPSIVVTVPTRYSLVTIAGPRDVPFDEWSRMSEIVCRILEQKLGGERYRGRPLARTIANATRNVGD